MTDDNFIKMAKDTVVRLHNSVASEKIKLNDVFVVWYAKTLQNHKALLATPIPGDEHYYEATYNGDKCELYLDVYNKELNKRYKIGIGG